VVPRHRHRPLGGSKILSVSGDCARPGIYEYPFGTRGGAGAGRLRRESTQAVQVSGASGICIDETEFQRRIAFETCPPPARSWSSTTRATCSSGAQLRAVLRHESCGFCTPCRVGTELVRKLMDKLAAGLGSPHDLAQIVDINRLLQSASHCGLGHTACNPVLDTMKRFRPAYEQRMVSLDYAPPSTWTARWRAPAR